MQEENYMRRCLELAILGRGSVAPNPMVGALLIYEKVIIGEGYHEHYGQPHAEVNCLNSVKPVDRGSIEESTMYVSLEPCAHFGKTPPCADLLIGKKIKRVVVGCIDSNKEVGGKGIQRMREAGLEVQIGVLENECRRVNERFFTFHEKKRPYLILKWAQSMDGIIGTGTEERLFISNRYTNRLVHKWRTEEAAILVGTRTALQDDPLLTSRKWPGHNPKRIIIDKELKIPSTHQVYNDEAYTIIFNDIKNAERKYIKSNVINGLDLKTKKTLKEVYFKAFNN